MINRALTRAVDNKSLYIPGLRLLLQRHPAVLTKDKAAACVHILQIHASVCSSSCGAL